MVLSRKQIKKHVDELNRMHKTLTLAAEWEVILLNAFSKAGKILHEYNFGGSTNPDLYFESHDNPKLIFVADITAISDKGFESHNPFDALSAELVRRVSERGLNPNNFHLAIQGNHPEIQRGHYYMERGDNSNTLLYKGGIKAKLHMPGVAKFQEKIFNDRWERFLDEIRNSPNEYKEYRVYKPQEQINIAISFNPGERYSSSTHLSYKQINHLTENRIYQALEDKAGQLGESNFKGHLGVILCDGGYSPFHAMEHFSTHSVKEVIFYFLRNYHSVSFVLTFVIKDNSFSRTPNEIIPRLYVSDSFPSEDVEILEAIEKVCKQLPEPESNAFNALNHLRGRDPQEGRRNGELTLSAKEIRISARMLMDLLSGRVTHEEFIERYDSIPGIARTPGYTNFFDMRLKNGMLISDISIEKSDEEDDDVITIKLSGPDPAISPFTVPKNKR
jgi:hypothetical protein